ncbi:MAG: flagellar basal body-associated FliL family protein [Alphaproteobacteria bacterium]|nr:flagellar basal body-associated FliL family protein [Alphaproteobacteria bacterium]
MSEDLDENLDSSISGGAAPAEGGGKRKKLIIVVVLPILLLVAAGLGAHFTGLDEPLLNMFAKKDKAPEVGSNAAEGTAAVFYDLPDMLVNLNTPNNKKAFLKIRVSLELGGPEDVPRVEAVIPRIVDNFQVYLRELRLDDLQGAAGMYRLREELLARVVDAAKPARVTDVLFKEMLVQ